MIMDCNTCDSGKRFNGGEDCPSCSPRPVDNLAYNAEHYND